MIFFSFFFKLIIWNIDNHTCRLDSTFLCPHLLIYNIYVTYTNITFLRVNFLWCIKFVHKIIIQLLWTFLMEINFLGCDCLQVNCSDFIQAVSSICNHMFWGMVIIGILHWCCDEPNIMLHERATDNFRVITLFSSPCQRQYELLPSLVYFLHIYIYIYIYNKYKD